MILYIHNKRKEVIKMKVIYDKKETKVYLSQLVVGTAFFSKRSSTDEIGLYMVVDKSSGVFLDVYRRNNILAVNLSSGKIRAFNGHQKVEPVEAEVHLPE